MNNLSEIQDPTSKNLLGLSGKAIHPWYDRGWGICVLEDHASKNIICVEIYFYDKKECKLKLNQ